MKSIFQHAEAVFAWLGPAEDNGDIVLSLFRTIADQAEALDLTMWGVFDIVNGINDTSTGAVNNIFGKVSDLF